MSYGLICRSDDGGVLLSTDVSHLHFQGFATHTGASVTNYSYGGCTVFSFRSNAKGVPMLFIRQTGLLASVIRLDGSSGDWYFTVMREGTDTTPPQVFVFTQPHQMTPSGNVGMLLRNSSNEVVFDSRLLPFVASSASYVSPSGSPPNSGIPPAGYVSYNYGVTGSNPPFLSCDWDFSTSGTRLSQAIPAVSVPIVASYSTGQACYERRIMQYWEEDPYGPIYEYHWRFYLWYCFYREAVAVSGGTLRCGWVPYSYGFLFNEYEEQTFIGFDYGNKWESISPPAPFRQKTTNIRNNVVIVADGSMYI